MVRCWMYFDGRSNKICYWLCLDECCERNESRLTLRLEKLGWNCLWWRWGWRWVEQVWKRVGIAVVSGYAFVSGYVVCDEFKWRCCASGWIWAWCSRERPGLSACLLKLQAWMRRMQTEKKKGLHSGPCQLTKESGKQPLRHLENQEGVFRKCQGGRDQLIQKIWTNQVRWGLRTNQLTLAAQKSLGRMTRTHFGGKAEESQIEVGFKRTGGEKLETAIVVVTLWKGSTVKSTEKWDVSWRG